MTFWEYFLVFYVPITALVVFFTSMFLASQVSSWKDAKRFGYTPKVVAAEAKNVKRLIIFLIFSPVWPLYAPYYLCVWVKRGIVSLINFLKKLDEDIQGPVGLDKG